MGILTGPRPRTRMRKSHFSNGQNSDLNRTRFFFQPKLLRHFTTPTHRGAPLLSSTHHGGTHSFFIHDATDTFLLLLCKIKPCSSSSRQYRRHHHELLLKKEEELEKNLRRRQTCWVTITRNRARPCRARSPPTCAVKLRPSWTSRAPI